MDSDDDDTSPTNSASGATAASDNGNTSSSINSDGKMETIKQNTVVYRLYWLVETENGLRSSKEALEELASLRAFAFNLAKDYVWHNEPFRLFYAGAANPCYFGHTNYGDSAEDEWFIVYVLYEISRRFPHLVINVIDSDGQFLLIEAADVLSTQLRSWLENDDLAEHRVFIYNGELYVVPEPKELQPLPQLLSNGSFEQLLTRDPGRLFTVFVEHALVDRLRAPDNVQRVIQKRIGAYPQQISFQRHLANCLLPAKLAAVVNRTGSFFLPVAVHLACQEDEQKQTNQSPISFTDADLITTTVTFSKHLYAKLLSCQRIPNVWSCWSLPKKDEFGYKANELGMKLTRGFEILCNKSRGRIDVESALTTSYDRYIAVLKTFEHCKGAPAGSKPFDSFMLTAKLNYLLQAANGNEDDYVTLIGMMFTNTLADLEDTDVNALRRECILQDEDDDDWLTISPDQLDAILSQKASNVEQTSARAPALSALQSAKMCSSSAFNGEKSILDVVSKNGVSRLFNDDNVPARDCAEKAGSSTKGIDFDPGTFADSLRRMLDLHIPQDGDDSSDMESYGDEDLDLTFDEKSKTTANEFANGIVRYMDFLEGTTSSAVSGAKSSTKSGRSCSHSKLRDQPEKTTQQHKQLHSPSEDSIDFEDDDFKPVDIDNKLVSGMLESFFPETCDESASATAMLHGKPFSKASTTTKKQGDID